MIIKKYDKKYRFISMFDTANGFYMRSGVFDEQIMEKIKAGI